jgi:hypothetical protein
MLGWHISVYRQQNDGTSPALFGAALGRCLAIWQAPCEGMDWINELVKEQKVISLGGDGYPYEFTVMTKHLKTRLLDGRAGFAF